MEEVTAQLATCGLESYASALEDEGYDDWSVLKKEADKKSIASDVGMSEEDATKFVALLEGASAAPAKPAATPLTPMERITAALKTVGLEKYAEKLDEEGYDDWEVLSKEEDKKSIADDVGMSEEEANKFIALFESARSSTPKPLLLAMYGAPNSAEQGRGQLKALCDGVKEAYGMDSLVLDMAANYEPMPLTWELYIEKLVSLVDAASTSKEQKLIVFCYSFSAPSAYCLTVALGARVIKFFPCGCRPPHLPSMATMNGVWGVTSRENLRTFFDEPEKRDTLVKFTDGGGDVYPAWSGTKMEYMGNRVLKAVSDSQKPGATIPGWVKPLHELVKRTYCDSLEPKTAIEIAAMFGEEGEKATKVSCDIVAICGGGETPRGEDPPKMARWAELTTGSFTLEVIEGGEHAELVDNNLKTKALAKGYAAVIEALKKDLGAAVEVS